MFGKRVLATISNVVKPFKAAPRFSIRLRSSGTYCFVASGNHQRCLQTVASCSSSYAWRDATTVIQSCSVAMMQPTRRFHAKRHSNYPTNKRSEAKTKSIELNNEIDRLGKGSDWKGILTLYEKNAPAFNDVNFATAIARLARIPFIDKNDGRFQTLISHLQHMIATKGGVERWIGLRQYVNVIHGIAKMGLRHDRAAMRIVESVDSQAGLLFDRGNPRDVANITWACATLGVKSPLLFSELEWNAARIVHDGNSQDIANCVWACATLGVASPQLFAALEANAERFVQEGTSQALANSVWACATLGVQSPKLFLELDLNADRFVGKKRAQEIANSVWACATLGVQSPELFIHLDRNARWFVNNGRPRSLAVSVWACATMGFECPQLFSKLEQNADWFIQKGSSQDISNSLWACATLGLQSPKLFASLEKNVHSFLKQATSQEVSNTVWACATLGIKSPKLFSGLETSVESIVANGNPQELANIIWSCATLKVESPKLFAKIQQRSEYIVNTGTPQNIANIVWSFATMKVEATQLFNEIERRSTWFVEKGSAQAISNTVWASATLGRKKSPIDLYDLESVADVPSLNQSPQSLCNLCYGLACLLLYDEGKNSEVVLKLFWNSLMERHAGDLLDERSLFQMAYVQVLAESYSIDLRKPSPEVEERLSGLHFSSSVSSGQLEVSSCLSNIGVEHCCEFPIVDKYRGLLSIDFAYVSPEQTVAIEYDGPSHFVKGVDFLETAMRDGPTNAKSRFLEHLGWKVVRIDWKDWIIQQREGRGGDWLQEILHEEGVKIVKV